MLASIRLVGTTTLVMVALIGVVILPSFEPYFTHFSPLSSRQASQVANPHDLIFATMTSSKAVILLLMIILLLIAVALISRLLRHVNSFEQELLRISNVFLSQGDYDSSLSVLKKIHEAGRCHGPCLLRAGLLEKRRGNFQDGVRYCKEAVAKGNTCGQPEAWNCLFASYMGQGRYGDATAALSHLRDCHHLSSPLATLFAAFEKSHDRLVLRAIHHLDIITPDLEKKGKGEDQLICHYSRVLAEELGLKHLLSDLRWPTASCPDFLQPKAEGTELNELEDKKKLDQPMVSSMVDNEFSGREKTVEETVQDIELITSPPSVSAEAQEEIVPDLHRADQAQTEVVVEAGEKEVESRVVRDESVGDASVVSTKNLSEHIDPQIVTSTAPSLSPSEHIVHVPVLREATGYEVEIPTESNQEQKDKQNLTEEPQTANIGERDALVKEDAEPDQELTVSLESRQKEQDEENFGQEADSTIIEEVETAASSEEEVERLLQRPLETDQGQAEGSNEVEEVEVGVATQTKVEAEKTEPSDSPRNELEPAQTVVEHQQGSSESVVDEVSLLTTSPTDQLQREGKEGEPKEEDSEPVEAPAPVDGAVEAVQVDEDVIQNADDLTRHVSNVQAPTVTERNVTEQGQEGAIISDSAIPEIRVSQENKTETTLNNSESLATPLETSQATKDLNHTQLEKDKGDILIIPGTPSLPEPSSTANETLPTANSTANNELSVANASHALPTSSQAIQLTEAEKRAIASARPYLTLALAYLGKDDTVNGMKQLDKVLKKAPKYADALFTRGSVYMDLGDIDKAVQDLKIVYRDLDPGNATVFEDLETALMAYLQQQQYPAAYEIYQLLVKDLPVTTKQTAWALTEMLEAVKEYSQAANLWEEMVRQELIRSTDAIPILAQLYNRMGELEKAESYYLQAIELQMASYQTLGEDFV
eukprot:scaffold3051_cov167-Ochromonas_danica.AAC.22